LILSVNIKKYQKAPQKIHKRRPSMAHKRIIRLTFYSPNRVRLVPGGSQTLTSESSGVHERTIRLSIFLHS
jgi:hypothetical protein